MKKTIFIITLVFITGNLISQESETKFTELKYMQDSLGMTESGGNVIVYQDAKLHDLMFNYSKAYKRKPDKVFRVQIYFGIGREARFKAQNVQDKFEKNHPGVPTFLIFEEPHFKVKVGDFDTKLDAERLKNQLKKEYGTLFITEDTKE